MSVSRRDALKTFAATLGAATLSEAAWAQALAVRSQAATRTAGSLAFFTAPQHRLVDVLSELIIPADDRSPGASAAKVADFIDLLVSSALDSEQAAWRDGLAALDTTATARWQHGFVECAPDQQAALLTEMSRREADPQTPLEELFVLLKERTIQGYYTSEIGIHQELRYKGNKFLTEFVGCTHPEHMS
jgi:gluconate 2-dehydrogenase gamma chain